MELILTLIAASMVTSFSGDASVDAPMIIPKDVCELCPDNPCIFGRVSCIDIAEWHMPFSVPVNVIMTMVDIGDCENMVYQS